MPNRAVVALALLWAQFPPGARGAPAPCKDETVGLLRPKPLVDIDSAVSFPRAQGGRSNGRISSIDLRSGNVTVRFLKNGRPASATAHRSELGPPNGTDGVPPAKSDNALRREFLSRQLEDTLPDKETRLGLLRNKTDINDEKKMAIAELIHDGRNNIEDGAITDLGLKPDQAEALREMKILDSDPFRLHLLTTRPPMARKQILPTAPVSFPNENGNLQNANVVKMEEGNVHVKPFPRKNKGATPTLVLPVREVHRHIASYPDTIIKTLDNGLPTAAMAHADLSADTVGVKPRARTGTATRDLSSPTNAYELTSLNALINKLKSTQINSPRFIELNNDWMLRVQSAMRHQGISTSLTRAESPTESPIFNLKINGVHPNGNKAARLYMKIAEQQGAQSVTISLYDNIKQDRGAFFDPRDIRVDIGYHAALSMLEGSAHRFAFHELRHLMFQINRNTGRNSLFDLHFYSATGASKNLNGRNIKNSRHYDKDMVYEELYTYTSDAFRTSRDLNKELLVIPIHTPEDGWSGPPMTYSAVDLQIEHSLQRVEQVSENSERVLNDVLKNHDGRRILDVVSSTDPNVRSVLLPSDSRQIIRIPLPEGALQKPERTSKTIRTMLVQAKILSSKLKARARNTRAMPIHDTESRRAKRRALREMLMLVHRAGSSSPWEGQRP